MLRTTKTVTTRYAEVTVRRPGGEIETVRLPKITYITTALWPQIVKATADAGKGQCLSYRNGQDSREEPMTLAEQRADLLDQRSAALDAAQDAAERALRTSIGGCGGWERVKQIEAEIAAFDAAHPEIKQGIDAQRAARASNPWTL